MKKITLIVTVLSLALSANAQLKVSSNGQVVIGKETSSGSSQKSPGIIRPISLPDTSASIRVVGKAGSDGGKIAFGNSKEVYIAEIAGVPGNSMSKSSLDIKSDGGLFYRCGNSIILQYDPNLQIMDVGNPFKINAIVCAPQFLTQSDANLKKNIEPLEDMGKSLAEITPVSYILKSNAGDDNETGGKASARSQEGGHLQYGFIAQEVKEVYPDLVFEDSEGLLSIDYTGFIPILVDAVKDLKAQLRDQELVIDSLRNQQQHKFQSPDSDAVVASLSQNRPNPFRVSTVIECNVPETVSSSFICVYDLNGSQKLRKDIPQRGKVEVTIDGNTFPAGMYIYTLICDGQEIDSKRMILTD